MPSTEQLNAWVQAVGACGDRQAFAALFRHFAPRLKGFLLRTGAPDDLAEELAQEAMATLWRRAAAFDPARAQLATWLYTIARNLRVDHHRVRAGGAASELDDAALDELVDEAAPRPEERLAAAQRRHRLREAMSELPPEQAQVLQLSFFHEETHECIARRLGIPLGTVKSRIRLAVGQLRRRLEGLAP